MQQNMAVLVAFQPDCHGEWLAYELAFNEAMRLSWLLPPLTEEESPLVASLGEAAGEVCTLVALAWELRQHRQQLMTHLLAAETLAAKVQTWVAFAAEGGYLSVEDGRIHGDLYEDILKEIRELIQTASMVVRLAA